MTLEERMEAVLSGAAAAAEVLPEDVAEFLARLQPEDREGGALQAWDAAARVRQSGLALLRKVAPRLSAEQRRRAAQIEARFRSLPCRFASAVRERLRGREC